MRIKIMNLMLVKYRYQIDNFYSGYSIAHDGSIGSNNNMKWFRIESNGSLLIYEEK